MHRLRRASIRRVAPISWDRPRGIWILPLAGAAVALALLPITTSDFTDYVIPWLRALQQRGPAGLSGEFSDYTPPYLYLLYLVKGLELVRGGQLVDFALGRFLVDPVEEADDRGPVAGLGGLLPGDLGG
ncbi:MAG TPA: hypothetical protein VE221_09220, partial [Sphingomicrobium sp.]|nr:hypothetical protein [Sphingomicrobium sp.]